jgi:hypothetical protein
LYLHHGFLVIFVCRFSHLNYYNINKSIKLIYTCHAHVDTLLPSALFGWCVEAYTMVKKGWLPIHPIWKVAGHLLGRRVLSSERWFDHDWSFYSYRLSRSLSLSLSLSLSHSCLGIHIELWQIQLCPLVCICFGFGLYSFDFYFC